MINIFIGKENLPKDKKFIFDIDAFSAGLRIHDNDFSKKVLEELEKGRYLSDDIFYDRFGRGLYVGCLSTGSKILLSMNQNPDFVINCSELGFNALDLIMDIKECNAYFNHGSFDFQCDLKSSVSVNGVLCNSVDEVNSLINR